MDKTILITLLIASALAMPVWMAWRKANERPWLGGWLFVVGLLALPIGLTLWLLPEWLAIPALDLHGPVKFYLQYLVLLPAFLSLCVLGGGMIYLLAPLALAILLGVGKAFGEAFKGVEWQQDEDEAIENEASWGTETYPSKERNSFEYDLYELDHLDVYDVYSEKG